MEEHGADGSFARAGLIEDLSIAAEIQYGLLFRCFVSRSFLRLQEFLCCEHTPQEIKIHRLGTSRPKTDFER